MFKTIMVGIGTVVAIVAYIATIVVMGTVVYNTTRDESLVLATTLGIIIIPLLGVIAGIWYYNRNVWL